MLSGGKRYDWRLGWSLAVLCGLVTVGVPSVARGQGVFERLRERMRERLEEAPDVPSLLPPPRAEDLPEGLEPPAGAVGAGGVVGAGGPSPLVLGVELAEQGLRPPFRLVVREVTPGAAAERAGIRVGDVILRIDGRPVGLIRDVSSVVRLKRPGDTMIVDVERDGRPVRVEAKFAAAAPGVEAVRQQVGQQDAWAARLGGEGVPPVAQPAPGSGRLGVTVENVSSAEPGEGVPVRRGAVVVSVAPGTPAADVGIQAGDMIVALDGLLISSAEALIAEMSKTQPGQAIELSYYQGRQLKREKLELAGRQPAGAVATEGLPGAGDPRAIPNAPVRREPMSGQAEAGGAASGQSEGLFNRINGALGGLLGGGTAPPASTLPESIPGVEAGAPAAARPGAPVPRGQTVDPANPGGKVGQMQTGPGQSRSLPAGRSVEALLPPPPSGAITPSPRAVPSSQAVPSTQAGFPRAEPPVQEELRQLREQVKRLQQRIGELEEQLRDESAGRSTEASGGGTGRATSGVPQIPPVANAPVENAPVENTPADNPPAENPVSAGSATADGS